ncbi:response regulator [Kiloniella laminariae]|uniref:response regulator n=1 Tax=Kiloniella laminariae TaxID=454162 RepID=UPI000475E65E|nr:response regulator [Kiloniella laminariae]
MPENHALKSILLVDDNRDDYEATLRSFHKSSLMNPLYWCKSGQDALDYLHKEGAYGDNRDPLPGIILLDLNMPGIDGRKVLEILKKDSVFKKIPIIILTTSADEKNVDKCYELGASTYIQKPVGFDGLIQATNRIKEYWFGIALLPGE